MKKFLVILLALVMVLSLVACGEKNNEETDDPGKTSGTENPGTPSGTEDPGTTTPGTTTDPGTENPGTEDPGTTVEPAAGEEITATPIYYNGFETTDGLTAVHRGTNVATDAPELTGATYALLPSAHEVVISDGYGAAGNSLVLDGKYGVRIENFPKTADDTYTISFWYAADRYSQYGCIVTMGHNVGMNDQENQVAWINFTKADAWSVEAGEAAPVVWNRNSAPSDGSGAVWPWIGNNAGLRGKKEWVHVTLVVDGQAYKDDAGFDHVGATVYVDGVPVMSATPANTADTWMGVAPEILTTEGIYGVEALIGINYWDPLYKGYIDELYVYDEALTPGQVTTLYQKGTAPEYESVPKYEGPIDEEVETTVEPTAPTLPEITPDAAAIDVLGTTARDAAFWTDTTDGYEVKDGATVTLKMNNYSDGASNWDNFVLGFSNTAVTTDKVAGAADFPGYFEWFVLRADAYGWAPEGAAYTPTFEAPADWAAWLALMTDAEVTAVITRNGGEITVDYTFTGADGTVMTEKAVVTSNLTAADPCYVHVTTDHAYVEILSVE